MTITYMLDTNVFNALRDGIASQNLLPEGGVFVVTSVQRRELEANPDPIDRDRLLKIFKDVAPDFVETTAALFGESEFDGSQYSDGKAFTEFFDALNDRAKRKNNHRDALIALTSIQNHHTLITSDRPLAEVTESFGGRVYYFPYGSGDKPCSEN